ncbi:GNAT family N-acetyltransferase [Nocardia sp. NPDC052112]|uniref:GNAT family N-acetyltransferase n=1 Tax=Nocardia sp. NPDC052112 TaxID=3155646 RepID=UPI00342836E4
MAYIRSTNASDLDELNSLDAQCFPPNDPDHEPASESELRDGVSGGRIFVSVDDDEKIIGFIHFEQPSVSHVYISSLAVREDWRGRGIGASLLDHLMALLRRSGNGKLPSVSTMTSPENHAMLRLLFSRRFVARTIMRGYFGAGRDRIYCQHKLRVDFLDPDERYLVPTESEEHWDRLLSDEKYVITSIVQLPTGPAFEFCRFDRDDLAGLESDEVSTSVTFAGTVLAAVTFLFGFSLASDNFPSLVRALLLASTLATTMALVIYTNSAGDIARLRSNSFNVYMRTGNVLSESGGFYPFLISLPITFSYVSASIPAGVIAGSFFVVSLGLYEASPFSISSRFRRSPFRVALLVLIITAPLSGVVAIQSDLGSWIWTIGIALVLIALSISHLSEPIGERRRPTKRSGWDTRD